MRRKLPRGFIARIFFLTTALASCIGLMLYVQQHRPQTPARHPEQTSDTSNPYQMNPDDRPLALYGPVPEVIGTHSPRVNALKDRDVWLLVLPDSACTINCDRLQGTLTRIKTMLTDYGNSYFSVVMWRDSQNSNAERPKAYENIPVLLLPSQQAPELARAILMPDRDLTQLDQSYVILIDSNRNIRALYETNRLDLVEQLTRAVGKLSSQLSRNPTPHSARGG